MLRARLLVLQLPCKTSGSFKVAANYRSLAGWLVGNFYKNSCAISHTRVKRLVGERHDKIYPYSTCNSILFNCKFTTINSSENIPVGYPGRS